MAGCTGEPGGVRSGDKSGINMGLDAEAWERGCEKGLSSSSSGTMEGVGFNTLCID
jgi:hypothetical protein